MTDAKRREFLKQLAAATSSIVVMPMAISCGGAAQNTTPQTNPVPPTNENTPTTAAPAAPAPIPLVAPADWDAVAFNQKRGNAGAIPQTYLADINGPDGRNKHLGKHLPYVPKIDPNLVPEGFLALMWGDPALGYAAHPNAAIGDPAYPKGHFYNWIRLRKATPDSAEEKESTFGGWPIPTADDTGKYTTAGNAELSENSGKNTIYLIAMPQDVVKGDTIRVYGHCLYHGEYVDFLTL